MASIFAEPLYNQQLAVVGKGWQHEFTPATAEVRDLRSADNLTISYDQASKSYLISAPLAGSGTLMQVEEYGTYPFDPGFRAEASNRPAANYGGLSFSLSAPNRPGSRYSYVAFVDLYATAPAGSNLDTIAYGAFAVGQPTRAGDIPTTGTARYLGDLRGNFGGDGGGTWIEGSSTFDFDFGRGTLLGQLKVSMFCLMGCSYDDVTYSLAQTSYQTSAATFNGRLTTGGAPSNGTFSGMFAGPGAREMMAQFELPFFNPEYNRWMTAAGAIVGKRE